MATNVAQDRLGDLFVSEGLVTHQQLQEGLREARSTGTRLGYALVKLGLVAEEELTRMLAKQYRVPAVALDRVEVDLKVLRTVPADVAHKHLVLPLRRVGRTLKVAMANPTDLGAIDDLKFVTKMNIEAVVAGEYTLRKHLERYYETADEQMAVILEDLIEEDDLEFVEDEQDDESLAALTAEVNNAPVVKFINGLLTDAVMMLVSMVFTLDRAEYRVVVFPDPVGPVTRTIP
jgi:type IV pilus assembly protein PilB